MTDKLGNYISSLMSTIVDKDNEEFVQNLARQELERLNIDIQEFLRKHQVDDEEESKKTIKKLLQEEIKDGND
tara:strand:- start:3 stop:221 length:219 start_codon:yes stop_codon:yes gene_type:complete